MNTAGNYTTACACSNVLCVQYGWCQKMKQPGYPGAGTYTSYIQPPRGCICPPGANKECENQYCPRKALPVSAHIEVKK